MDSKPYIWGWYQQGLRGRLCHKISQILVNFVQVGLSSFILLFQRRNLLMKALTYGALCTWRWLCAVTARVSNQLVVGAVVVIFCPVVERHP